MLATRRVLMGTSLLALPALAGCAWFTSKAPTVTAQVANDLALFNSATQSAEAELEGIVGAPAGTAAKVTQLAADLSSAAAKVVAGVVQNIALPVVQQVNNDFTALKTALTGVPNLPAWVTTYMNDAAVILPLILIGVGAFMPAAAAANDNTAENARAGLRKIAAGVR